MTRDEYIDKYLGTSGFPRSARRPDGVEAYGIRLVAVPCDCGSPRCEGWKFERVGPIRPPAEGGEYTVRSER